MFTYGLLLSLGCDVYSHAMIKLAREQNASDGAGKLPVSKILCVSNCRSQKISSQCANKSPAAHLHGCKEENALVCLQMQQVHRVCV